MKYIAPAALCAAIMLAPLAALADQTSPAPPPQGGAGSGGFQQIRQQVDAARAQARTTMLGALSAQHRSLLAQVVGNLAIAQTPDVSAAAKKLDGSLTAAESKAILDAQSALDAQIRQIMDAARQQNGGQSDGGMRPRGGMGGGSDQAPDAGMALLRAAVPPMGPPMMMRMGGPPPGS
jgi:hypothetical protein